MDEGEKYLSNWDLAIRYAVPVKTIRKWRYEGTGPQGFPAGRHVRYRESDVRRWEEEQLADEASAT